MSGRAALEHPPEVERSSTCFHRHDGNDFGASARSAPAGNPHRHECRDCHAQSPNGENSPSEAGIKVTRDLIRAGQLLKLERLDHVVIGNGNFSSLRALGCIYQ